METEIEFTPEAATLLLNMRANFPSLVLLIDDTSCCSNSSIIARRNRPSWPVDLLWKMDGVEVYVNPLIHESLNGKKIQIDAVDFTDDSLSLETDYGKRLIMALVR